MKTYIGKCRIRFYALKMLCYRSSIVFIECYSNKIPVFAFKYRLMYNMFFYILATPEFMDGIMRNLAKLPCDFNSKKKKNVLISTLTNASFLFL